MMGLSLHGRSAQRLSDSLDWLEYLAKTAVRVLLSGTSEKSPEQQLLAYDRRHGKEFLGDSEN